MRGRWRGGRGKIGGESNAVNLKVKEICKYFVLQGSCKFGTKCNFSHVLRQVGIINKAHTGGVRCATVVPNPSGILELYTGGCDGNLKHWSISPLSKDDNMNNNNNKKGINYGRNPKSNVVDRSNATMLSLNLGSTVNCSAEVCSCIIHGDVLFCGLINGTIRAFHTPTGTHMDLIGHNHEIHEMIMIEYILVSACWGGKVVFWKFDNASSIFTITAQMQLREHIKCLKCFPYINNQEPNAVSRNCLWVCGGGFIQIIDLSNLQLIREISLDGGPIMSVLEYESHLVLCSLQGIIRVLNSNSDETYRKSLGSPSLCMEGCNGGENKHLLSIGQQNGHLKTISLPLFDNIFEFHSPDNRSEIRLITNLGGSPGIFMTAQWDGTLTFYQWCNENI